MELTKLERAVLDWIADHSDDINLKEQITAAVPTEREFTGVGSFTTLSVPKAIPPTSIPRCFSGPIIESEGIEYGGSAILFRDAAGYIETLEMVANGDRFDEQIDNFSLMGWEESSR